MMWIKINETTFRYEDKGVRFFLLLGTECALLIDSGMTVTNARELAAEVTSLPVKLFNTHTDPDHIGSNEEFSEVMMNPAELVNYRKPHTSQNIIPMYDGDITSDDFSSWLSSVTYQDGTPLLTKYPFMAEVAARVVTEGSDIYCIVPAHAGDSVSVCQWLYSTTDDGQWSEKAGNTIYASDTSEPVLIQASAGEFNPNFAVSLRGTDGRSFDNHVLVTSGMDGKLVLPTDEQGGQALLSDFSPYAY